LIRSASFQAQIKRRKTMATGTIAVSYGVEARSVPKGALVLLERLFFALTFLVFGAGHFAKPTIAYAAA
jgi:hypothetical protein